MLTRNESCRDGLRTVVAGKRAHRRSGIVTLEAIIWLPVLVILLCAVVEMGLILTAAIHVEAASRLAAKLAAENAALSSPGQVGDVAENVRVEVDEFLASAGYGAVASAGVRIQTTLNGGESDVDGTCPEYTSPPLPAGPPDSVRAVVCVPIPTVAPNLLRTFGFDTSSMTLELATTMPYEEN